MDYLTHFSYSVFQLAQQALPNPSIDAAVEEIKKGHLLNGILIAFVGAFFILLIWALYKSSKPNPQTTTQLTELRAELVALREDMKQRDIEYRAQVMALLREATESTTTMSNRGADLVVTVGGLREAINALSTNVAILIERKGAEDGQTPPVV